MLLQWAQPATSWHQGAFSGNGVQPFLWLCLTSVPSPSHPPVLSPSTKTKSTSLMLPLLVQQVMRAGGSLEGGQHSIPAGPTILGVQSLATKSSSQAGTAEDIVAPRWWTSQHGQPLLEETWHPPGLISVLQQSAAEVKERRLLLQAVPTQT